MYNVMRISEVYRQEEEASHTNYVAKSRYVSHWSLTNNPESITKSGHRCAALALPKEAKVNQLFVTYFIYPCIIT